MFCRCAVQSSESSIACSQFPKQKNREFFEAKREFTTLNRDQPGAVPSFCATRSGLAQTRFSLEGEELGSNVLHLTTRALRSLKPQWSLAPGAVSRGLNRPRLPPNSSYIGLKPVPPSVLQRLSRLRLGRAAYPDCSG